MSRGYPDFSGATAFPTRKHLRVQDCLVVTIPINGIEIVFNLSGQTIIEGGYLFPGASANLSSVWFQVRLDGQLLAYTQLSKMGQLGVGGPTNFPLYCTYYDEDSYWSTVMISNQYYCGYEYIVTVKNLTGAALFPVGKLLYSDVT